MMNKIWLYAVVALLSVVILSIRGGPASEKISVLTDGGEKLIVITQPDDTHFRVACLPQLEAWAKVEGITLLELDKTKGIPEDITATPAIVFQNPKGRSVYTSRYAEFSTIKNFVRTNRLRTQTVVPFCAEEVLQWTTGRAKLSAPLKLTALQRENKKDELGSDFEEQAAAAFHRGMNKFELKPEACLSRTDRTFYCDVHPYLAADGELFLSLELYSMFNCIRPVFTTGEAPLRGSSSTYQELFEQAGALLQTKITAAISSSTIGDAWTPISSDIATTTWESLGLGLPETVTQNATELVGFTLNTNWTTEGAAIPGVPPLFFRFMAPLDRYAGEVPALSGELRLNKDGSLQAGEFTADLRTLTMGMAELDDKVKRKYIYTKRFPEANFSFELSDQSVLQTGRTNRVPVAGTFLFMNKEIPLLVQAEITPQLDTDGVQQLLVHVPFELNITDDFGVQGPDGPDPARKTMLFDLNFFMSPQ